MKNFNIKKYSYLDHDDSIAWYAQYGTPRAAAYYPHLKKTRARIGRELQERGIDLRDFNGYVCDYDGTVRLLGGRLVLSVKK